MSKDKITVAFLVFEGMQLLDFANPWEVFAMWNKIREHSGGKLINRVKFSIDSYDPVSYGSLNYQILSMV